MERRTYALLVSYDGRPFKGWQPQTGLRTVHGELIGAFRRAGVGATPFGASRTDAGVHARAQVASFHSRADLDPDGLRRALNDALPPEIRVPVLRPVPRSFHAHWSSTGKVYRFRLSFTGEERAWRLPDEHCPVTSIDRALLEEALAALVRAPALDRLCAGAAAGTPRRLSQARILAFDGGGATLEFEGPGFGKYMIRHAAALVAGIAGGTVPAADLPAVLAGEIRRPFRTGPDGLSLHRVLYPPEVDPFPDIETLLGAPARCG